MHWVIPALGGWYLVASVSVLAAVGADCDEEKAALSRAADFEKVREQVIQACDSYWGHVPVETQLKLQGTLENYRRAKAKNRELAVKNKAPREREPIVSYPFRDFDAYCDAVRRKDSVFLERVAADSAKKCLSSSELQLAGLLRIQSTLLPRTIKDLEEETIVPPKLEGLGPYPEKASNVGPARDESKGVVGHGVAPGHVREVPFNLPRQPFSPRFRMQPKTVKPPPANSGTH